ncbi:hypothetical protein [Reichenbachiella versicolor]|uniref:hypothetical protein n=1 Tax=Reichenbachiella versicolor TaxID=1821036 RepID=UPI0013A52DF5|nr:hypothetical protein [Reichenbachiella versicolor]
MKNILFALVMIPLSVFTACNSDDDDDSFASKSDVDESGEKKINEGVFDALYTTGWFKKDKNVRPIYYKDNEVIELNKLDADHNTRASYISIENEDIHILGESTTPSKLLYWHNGNPIHLPHETLSSLIIPVGISVKDGNVHIVAKELNTELYGDVFYWKNGVRQRISAADKSAKANDLLVTDDDVYIVGSEDNRSGGFSFDPDEPETAAYWKNGEKHLLTAISKSSEASQIREDSKDIYISVLERDSGNDIYTIYKNDVPVKSYPSNEYIEDFAVKNGKIHAIAAYYVTNSDGTGLDTKLKYYVDDIAQSFSSKMTQSISLILHDDDVYVSGVYFEGDNPKSVLLRNGVPTNFEFEGEIENVTVNDMILKTKPRTS